MQLQIDELYQHLNHPIANLAEQKNIQIKATAHYLDFILEQKIIRIALKHFVYSGDIIGSFEYYFTAVQPLVFNGYQLVDYSIPKYHNVVGFDLMPVFFPSFSEPVLTTQQYLNFANLKSGSTVFDLGAYSGLTSIMFKELVGKFGSVIALDADEQNILALRENLELYKKITGNEIDLVYGAIWNHNDGLSFSSEGNMGASASALVGTHRGNNMLVKSLTLSHLAEITKVNSVDFIKCDVEGAEAVIFEDAMFFTKYSPRIILETHNIGNNGTTAAKCIADLEKFGYVCKQIHQSGVALPLIECYPPSCTTLS